MAYTTDEINFIQSSLMTNNATMKEIMELVSGIKLQEKQLDAKLRFLEDEIRKLINSIKSYSSVEEATEIFTILGDYQESLSVLVFKIGYTVSENLRTFVKDFDRVDDLDLRSYIFSKIKTNEYKF